jgi:hypothetical protein
MSAFEDERTEHLASSAAQFAPEATHDERTRDIAALRVLVRKYGKFVEWAAGEIFAEPEREQRLNDWAAGKAELDRRLIAGEDLEREQILYHVYDDKTQQTHERVTWWLEHVLARAVQVEGNARADMLLAAVVLLGRYGKPRDGWRAYWGRVAELNTTTHHGLRRELERQGAYKNV